MIFKLNSRWPETRVCCPKTLCSGHLENKGVVGTLPGIETQGSYVAVVFKLNSRWPETTVCCPETLCSGHLENKGTVCCPETLCSGHLENKGVVGTLLAATRYSTSSSLSVNRSIASTHAQQSTALKSHSCFELVWVCKRFGNIVFVQTQASFRATCKRL